jgi:hypothetical protein
MEACMRGYIWVAVVLVIAWAVLRLGVHVVSAAVHLLLVAAIAVFLMALLRRGARGASR